MNDLTIIGISGKAGSGKDYISQTYLKPNGFYQWSFVWHLKAWIIGKGEATYEQAFHTKPPEIRKLLQQEGTENGRMLYGEDIWPNTMLAWFQIINEHWGINRFVIPDVRFPNEVKAVQNMGGKVFRIFAPNRVAGSNLTDEARTHISETALDDFKKFDGWILNDYSDEHFLKGDMADLLKTYYGIQSL